MSDLNIPENFNRNYPCPCKSGKKFKNCHALIKSGYQPKEPGKSPEKHEHQVGGENEIGCELCSSITIAAQRIKREGISQLLLLQKIGGDNMDPRNDEPRTPGQGDTNVNVDVNPNGGQDEGAGDGEGEGTENNGGGSNA